MKQTFKKLNWIAVAQIVITLVFMVVPFMSHGASITDPFPCQSLGGVSCEQTSLNGFIARIINWLLTISFGVAVLFLILGGFWYITSAGNEESAEKGKNTAINAIIGIVIILLSWVIVNVVVNFIGKGNTGTTAP